jgi:hypothetical protein
LLWSLAWAALSLIAWAVWYVVAKGTLRDARVQIPGWVEWFAPVLLLGVVWESSLASRRSLFFSGCLVLASCLGSATAVLTFS